MTHARRLRALLDRPGIVMLPGAGTPFDLRAAEAAGFEAGYVSGYAMAALRYGLPDIGLVGFGELVEFVRAARSVTDLPLIVDADTGYGDVANVRRTVQALEALGVAAIQIEDQVWPKKCGHMAGKRVEPQETAVRKIRAAVAARTNPDTVIVARTDARGPLGLDEAMQRCTLFAEAGADLLFVDGPTSEAELARIGAESPRPAIANMSESGLTPILSAAELEALGFRIAMWPSTSSRIAVRQSIEFFADLKATGDSRPWLDRIGTLDQTNAALGLADYHAFDAQFTDEQN